MPDIQELLDKQHEAAGAIRALADKVNDEGRDFTPEERKNWDKCNADYDGLTKRIEVIERASEIEARHSGSMEAFERLAGEAQPEGVERQEPRVTAQEMADAEMRAVEAWALTQTGNPLTNAHKRAARRLDVNLGSRDLNLTLLGSRAVKHLQGQMRANTGMATSSGEGGEFIPTGFVNTLERELLAFGGPRRVSRIIRTSGGGALHWPKVNDAANKGRLLAESAAVTEATIATTEMVLNAYKYSSDIVQVSSELIQDSAFDLGAELASLLAERVGRITSQHFTTGTGSAQPKGCVVASTVGVTAADTNSITSDELIDLQHSLDEAYRQNAVWMMNDGILKAIRKLKDGNNQYLWQPGIAAGRPSSLLEQGVVTNADMQATLATGTKVALYGNFKKFVIRDVAGIRIRHLTERYADTDREGFVVFSRHDSDLLTTSALKHMIMA